MASAGSSEFKSPKAPRRPKTPDSRQVHFEPQAKPSSFSSSAQNNGKITGFTSANSPSGGLNVKINGITAPKTPPSIPTTASAEEEKPNTQPTSFPALGVASNSQLQWHTSANPTQSLSYQVPSRFISPPAQQHGVFSFAQQPQFHPASFITASANNQTPITYIGIGPQPPAANTMGDYQNAAPPPGGVHFQPPVPDTTFGPIPHVYVPRFDGGLAGVQVGLPPVHFVSAPLPTAACTTVPVVGAMGPQPAAPGGYVVHQQPYYVQQPAMGHQPAFYVGGQQGFVPQAQHVAGVPAVGLAGGAAVAGAVPVFAGNTGHHIPEVSGVGRTAGEEQLRQIKFAHANRLYEPQDFKPADDDPSRFYFVREVDGNWTQRNRFTIDHIGDCRWYVTDEGWFYAVRLPN
ncbi:hypothetical protein FALBO_4493 [Fusarium albosuccineum]|uniref:Uncharacterized protein n=1 Tax=Fusarium albosuccineum TaxID=1237068 RepID=A0A8H4PDL4_9HYPO|nr:hypothetical protein FALBO_4493 [Fusarium albosuccineum]